MAEDNNNKLTITTTNTASNNLNSTDESSVEVNYFLIF